VHLPLAHAVDLGEPPGPEADLRHGTSPRRHHQTVPRSHPPAAGRRGGCGPRRRISRPTRPDGGGPRHGAACSSSPGGMLPVPPRLR
jgi:hypothetical protein